MRKSYVDTSHGQVHVRMAGMENERALLLLHWTPSSASMWEGIAPLFVERGFKVIAPDMLGYGRSDPRPDEWAMADWAATTLEVMAGLDIDMFDVLGGHNGASVATEMALAKPAAVKRMVLDGCAVVNEELRAVFAQMTKTPKPQAGDEGLERLVWDRASGVIQEYRPGIEIDAEVLDLIWQMMRDYLETGFVSSASVSGTYDLLGRLPLLDKSILFLAAETDPLCQSTLDAAKLLPDQSLHVFTGHHPIHSRGRHAEFAKIVCAHFDAA